MRGKTGEMSGGFENSEYVDEDLTEFWLREYVNYMENLRQDINDKTVFLSTIPTFLMEFPLFAYDINITSSQEIVCSGPSFKA